MRRSHSLTTAAVVLLLAGNSVSSDDTIALLSSEMGAYREVVSGLAEGMEENIRVLVLDGRKKLEIGDSTRVIVTLGGLAARQSFPDGIALVYCLAPGTNIEQVGKRRRAVKISMLAPVEEIVAGMKKVQPGIRSVGALWQAEGFEDDVRALRSVAKERGVSVVSAQVTRTGGLPSLLRRIGSQVDALWLMPDPFLINSANLSLIRSFSWGNDIPFYVPTAALAAQGAVASITPSFRNMGKMAAEVARSLRGGSSMRGNIAVSAAEVVINAEAAVETGVVTSAGRAEELIRRMAR